KHPLPLVVSDRSQARQKPARLPWRVYGSVVRYSSSVFHATSHEGASYSSCDAMSRLGRCDSMLNVFASASHIWHASYTPSTSTCCIPYARNQIVYMCHTPMCVSVWSGTIAAPLPLVAIIRSPDLRSLRQAQAG